MRVGWSTSTTVGCSSRRTLAGTVHAVRIARSSGQKILDDAAIRIVQIAAPFAPFPDQIRSEVDVLHITRTWQFLTNNQLISR